MSYCYCDDFDTVDMHTRSTCKVRKACVCRECRRDIAAGEMARSDSYFFEGKWYRDRTCSDCVALEEWIAAHVPCFNYCLPFGALFDQADEAIADLWRETVGLKFGYLRRKLKIMNRAKSDCEKRRLAASMGACLDE